MKPSVSLNFKSPSDPRLSVRTDIIVNCMDNELVYPDPIPTKLQIQEEAERFRNLLQETQKGGGRVAIAERDQQRKVLEPLLVQLGIYVMMVAKGNIVLLEQSGFVLNKSSYNPGHIPLIGNVTLTNGKNSGEMIASVKAIRAARAYGFHITDEVPTENTQWKVISVGTSKFLFQNLTPGKQYSVKVSVAGSRGQLVYSNIATMFVQ
jgi:hypothetical protein